MRTPLKAIISICTSLTMFSGNIALADGIASKDKSRSPMATSGQSAYGPFRAIRKTTLSTRQPRHLWRIHKSVERQTRLRERMAKKESSFIAKEEVKQANSNPSRQVDRIKLLKRGDSRLPMHCKNLHTHLRAVCQRDAQLLRKQTVKLAFEMK